MKIAVSDIGGPGQCHNKLGYSLSTEYAYVLPRVETHFNDRNASRSRNTECSEHNSLMEERVDAIIIKESIRHFEKERHQHEHLRST